MSVGMVPLPVLPARAPSPNLFSLSSKPFACHTSEESLKSSRLSSPTAPATPLYSIIGCANSFAPHTSKNSLETRAVNPFESTLLFLKFFSCHRSAKCALNSFICHTSKNAMSEVLCLPHIRDPLGGDGFVLNGNPCKGFRPVRPRGLQRSRSVQSPVTNYQSPLTLDCELSTVDFSLGPIAGPHRSCAIRRIDANVLCSEVASPVAGHGFARVQIHYQRNVFGKKFVAGGAFVEIERLAAPQHRDARHLNVDESGIKLHPGAPRSRKNSPPVWVAACEGGFHQRRSRNGLRDSLRSRFSLRAAHFDFDDALRALAVGHDLQRERTANFFQRGSERAMRGGASLDRRRPRLPVGKHEERVVRRSVAIHADRVERAARDVTQRFLQKGRRDRRIRGDKRKHRRHIGMNHPRTFGATHEMNSLPGHLERSRSGFRTRVRGANCERSFREGTRRRTAKARDDRQRAKNFFQRQGNANDACGADKQFLRRAAKPLRGFRDRALRSGVARFAGGAVSVPGVHDHGAHTALRRAQVFF